MTTFAVSGAESGDGRAIVLGSVSKATRTQLVVNIGQHLEPSDWGKLDVQVALGGINGKTFHSNRTQVADIRIARPILAENKTCTAPSNALSISLKGSGFNTVSEGNSILCKARCDDHGSYAVAGKVDKGFNGGGDELIFKFHGLAPMYANCSLWFEVTVASNTTISDACPGSQPCVSTGSRHVCNVEGSVPSVNHSDVAVYITTNKLTISGLGFDGANASNNEVRFSFQYASESTWDSQYAAKAKVAKASSTNLVLSFDTLSLYNLNALTAEVRVGSNLNRRARTWTNWSKTQQVANMIAAKPQVKVVCSQLRTNSPQLTIYGSGFDNMDPTSNNHVAFPPVPHGGQADIAGRVVSGSRSHLVFSFAGLQPSYSNCTLSKVNESRKVNNVCSFDSTCGIRQRLNAVVSIEIVPADLADSLGSIGQFIGQTNRPSTNFIGSQRLFEDFFASNESQVSKLISVSPVRHACVALFFFCCFPSPYTHIFIRCCFPSVCDAANHCGAEHFELRHGDTHNCGIWLGCR